MRVFPVFSVFSPCLRDEDLVAQACIRSNPVLVSPRSDSFKTEVTVYLSPHEQDRSRCAMQAKLRARRLTNNDASHCARSAHHTHDEPTVVQPHL